MMPYSEFSLAADSPATFSTSALGVSFGEAVLAAVAALFVVGAAAVLSSLTSGPVSVPRVVLAHPDLLPIAVVLGAGVLTWLLGNRRPRLEPARPRKPEPTKGRRTRDR